MTEKAEMVEEMIRQLGDDAVLHRKEDLLTYECDGLTVYRGMPLAVVFPSSTEEVSGVVKWLHEHEIPFIPRGAGTGLSGGATPFGGEVIISLVRMKRLLDVDYDNREAVVQPGYINLTLTNSITHKGFYYAPDPSSQACCTIGGNVAENAGGAHCLKYGVTTNHVLGLEVVLHNGEIVEIGGVPDAPGYDLMGLVTGSEGTLGIVTSITVRILKNPEAEETAMAYFDSVEDASYAVSGIIAAGIVPAAIEMMDEIAIQGVERATNPVGHPEGSKAVLIMEVDGIATGIEEQIEEMVSVCERHNVVDIKVAKNDRERGRWWANRKTAFGAMGAISPAYLVQDGVIPRSRLSEVLAHIADISAESGLRIANVFHAGDGNLHPLILFDARNEGETDLALDVGSRTLEACTAVGGSITGEHGVGIEKKEDMRLVFSDEEIERQITVRSVFNPHNLLNLDKQFPKPARCGEVKQAVGSGEAHQVAEQR
ncbi:FAD-linked oxidase C-terminal domain-containing protein [Natribacillus halophilus]|uniref:Glycolate oxidase n=1 Tax=Natribacillus halophilus TaxID=549003 RepID=A0A1G8LW83_9BACI|nr:FAD-linked oxidase C-terminal domain-containing protein [Natribacillus halophilus]SDI60012.1 glycolate oxidase [Natribacillus halophilus]